MIDSSNYTATIPNSPCIGCKRKNCTMSVFYGSSCEFAIYKDDIFSGSCPSKVKNFAKRSHGKKKSYHRGKF